MLTWIFRTFDQKGMKRRERCPKCRRRLVNIYRRGPIWRCSRCWTGGKGTGR